MGVQDGAGAAPLHDLDVQKRFRGWPACLTTDDAALTVNFKDLSRAELALVRAAGRDCQTQRSPRQDRTEVAARTQHPAARIEAPANSDQLVGTILKA